MAKFRIRPGKGCPVLRDYYLFISRIIETTLFVFPICVILKTFNRIKILVTVNLTETKLARQVRTAAARGIS